MAEESRNRGSGAVRRNAVGAKRASTANEDRPRSRGGKRKRIVHRTALPVRTILQWADAHHERTGKWPHEASGAVSAAPDENWSAINSALHFGSRGLPGGMSLARLLDRERNSGARLHGPPLKIRQVRQWLDAFHAANGRWPTNATRAPVPGAPGETWCAIGMALHRGTRGLPRGSYRALVDSRRPRLSVAKILRWAKEHQKRTGYLPHKSWGAVRAAPGETWRRIDYALRTGTRGLRKGQSLLGLWRRHFGVAAKRPAKRSLGSAI
jgi:hypothetical protein